MHASLHAHRYRHIHAHTRTHTHTHLWASARLGKAHRGQVCQYVLTAQQCQQRVVLMATDLRGQSKSVSMRHNF